MAFAQPPSGVAAATAAALAAANVDDLDDDACPICCELFDDADKGFLPCVCNYRVCMFCVRRLMTEFDGRCPGCRSKYNEANFRFKQLDPEELARQKRERAERKRQLEREKAKLAAAAAAQQQQAAVAAAKQLQLQQQQQQQQQRAVGASANAATAANTNANNATNATNANARAATAPTPTKPRTGPAAPTTTATTNATTTTRPPPASSEDPRYLANVRVVQRNTAFVTGLSPGMAREDVLRRSTHFGQFGQITRVVVLRPGALGGTPASPSPRLPSAYISFAHPEEARAAFQGVDGLTMDGFDVLASLGTARYCSSFLRGVPCTNPDCLNLHALGDDSATITREEFESGRLNYDFLDVDEDWRSSPSTSPPPPPLNESSLWPTPGAAVQLSRQNSAASSTSASAPSNANANTSATNAYPALPPTPTPMERLGGMDLASWEKRTPKRPLTLSRAPGEGVSRATPPPIQSSAAAAAAVMGEKAASCTEVLALAASLIALRAPMPPELRVSLSALCGPRAGAASFPGLAACLSSSKPWFVGAPTLDAGAVNIPWTDAVPVSVAVGMASGSSANAANANASASAAANASRTAAPSSTNTDAAKKANRKGRNKGGRGGDE